jgi:hypothetical protein
MMAKVTTTTTNDEIPPGGQRSNGIRHIAFNEKERTLRVEYDASHMSESAVARLLRDAGIDLCEKLVLA